jgi:hypothetical protein
VAADRADLPGVHHHDPARSTASATWPSVARTSPRLATATPICGCSRHRKHDRHEQQAMAPTAATPICVRSSCGLSHR